MKNTNTMAKFNTLSPGQNSGPLKGTTPKEAQSAGNQGNNLFNLKSFNELKKDQTNIKILKNSSFDSNFNSLQSMDTNLSLSSLLLQSSPLSSLPAFLGGRQGASDPFSNTDSSFERKGCLPYYSYLNNTQSPFGASES